MNYDKYRYQPDNEYACTGTAKQIVESLKCLGIEAKIYEVIYKKGTPDETGHCFVIPSNAKDSDLPLNIPSYDPDNKPLVGEIKKIGIDVTEDILSSTWDQLRG